MIVICSVIKLSHIFSSKILQVYVLCLDFDRFIYKEAKAELKTKRAAEKDDSKQEYLKKKEERRTDKTSTPNNNTPEKKDEVKNNGGQGSENNTEPGSD